MKAFSFRYQTVLEARERAMQAEEEKLAALLAKQREAEQAFIALQEALSAELAAWQAAQAEGVLDLATLLDHRMAVDGLERRIAAQREAIAAALARANQQRDVLLAAMMEKEVMAKLKERDQADWRKALETAENAFLDELATLRHGRTMRPGTT